MQQQWYLFKASLRKFMWIDILWTRKLKSGPSSQACLNLSRGYGDGYRVTGACVNRGGVSFVYMSNPWHTAHSLLSSLKIATVTTSKNVVPGFVSLLEKAEWKRGSGTVCVCFLCCPCCARFKRTNVDPENIQTLFGAVRWFKKNQIKIFKLLKKVYVSPSK